MYRFCSENSIEEKVIEKAYKKLKLDALVIQQGRLQDAGGNKSVKKEDLLEMVRNGADKIFSATGATITDEDVEAIITKGEEQTKDLNNKLQKFSESAIKFTLDGGMSVYDYEDEKGGEFSGIPEGVDLKSYVAANWIGPGTRERKKVKYNENEYYRDKMTGRAQPKGPRLPKIPQMHDFQFFDTARLTALFEMESVYEQHKHQVEQRRNYAIQQGASEEQVEAQAAEAEDENAPKPLTEEEVEEKDRLLEAGFSNWNKREFNYFIRANEKHGREDIAAIANDIEGKTYEEVKEYSEAFWRRYKEIIDFEKHIKNIEKGEQRIQRQADIVHIIESKLNRYQNPWRELKFNYGPSKGKAYNEDEDRFMLCMTHKLGYGAWEELKASIRSSWLFRFDWFIKSRTPQELGRRVDTLIRLIEKEA